MNFDEIMMAYFQGEKLEALYFILPVGLALMAFGGVALKVEKGGFAWGVAIPCFLFGLVLVGTGLGVGLRTNGQVAALKKGMESAPTKTLQAEIPRMDKVNGNFMATLKIAFPLVALLGLLLVAFVSKDWAKGVGAILVLAAGIGLVIDMFAYRRAVPYTEALVEMGKKHNVAVGAKEAGAAGKEAGAVAK